MSVEVLPTQPRLSETSMKRGLGAAECFVLDDLARGATARSERRWQAARDIALRWVDRKPTEAEIVEVDRAIRTLAHSGLVESKRLDVYRGEVSTQRAAIVHRELMARLPLTADERDAEQSRHDAWLAHVCNRARPTT